MAPWIEMNTTTEDNYISLETGPIRWLARREYGALPGRLMHLIEEGGLDPAKSSAVRRVFFLPASHDFPPLVLKEYRITGLGALLRAWCLGSSARREWNALRRLEENGIAVPLPLAMGAPAKLAPGSSTYLALIQVEDSCTLEEILLEQKPSPLPRKALASSLGRAIRKMHDAGVLHHDLHAANLLADASGAVYIMDLHGAGLHPSLSKRRRTIDLVSLAGAFLIHGNRTDRLRFYKAYAHDMDDKGAFKSNARRLEQAARDRLSVFLEKFDFRSLRSGRGFQPIHVHELTGIGERTDRAQAVAQWLGPYPLDTLAEAGSLIHGTKDSSVHAPEIHGERYIIKAYEKPGISGNAHRLFQGSKGKRAWFNYHRLFFRGIGIPKPVLFLEEPPYAPTGRSYIVTEYHPDSVTLDRFLASADTQAKIEVGLRLAKAVARLHTLFLRNRDMKAQNILVTPTREIAFIDPDGVATMRDPSLYVMAKDLMRVNASFDKRSNISLTDRVRFLKAYARRMRLDRSLFRELWREILHLTWTKWDRWSRYKSRRR